jgi:hypothetical protein
VKPNNSQLPVSQFSMALNASFMTLRSGSVCRPARQIL